MHPATLALLLTFAAPAAADEPKKKDLFSDPQNLEVLPEDISPAELRDTMRGFAMSLGVRCETCHVGEAGQPLDSFDFAADDKENKRVAREMMRMVERINRDHIGLLEGSRLTVSCMTCHRGVRLPMTTAQVLHQVVEEEGVAAAVDRYRELRKDYYGTHSYDFSESVLADLAVGLSRGGEPAQALELLRLNDEYFPDSFRNHWLKGEAAIAAGDEATARAMLERALEIGADPRSEAFLRDRLESLKSTSQ